jgi:ribosomal protein RSM22 (predicted rRNA methylase)
MQLPPALRQAIERELEGTSLADLTRASDTLSQRYRAETRDGRLHLSDELAAKAYLATRLPATFAAIAAAFSAAAERLPDFAPHTLLDVGAGPGTATFAASALYPSLAEADLLEASAPIREIGARLGQSLALDRVTWHPHTIADGLAKRVGADLVVLSYVLDELAPAARTALVEQLWSLAAGMLLIVEPGTTEGWRRILAARDQVIALGGTIIAPCPHQQACPLMPPDWCHFAARVARSRLHRETKSGSVPWEDEKFIYLIATRALAPAKDAPRVLAPPQASKAGLRFKLCRTDGSLATRDVPKRDRATYKAVRKAGWGDLLPE